MLTFHRRSIRLSFASKDLAVWSGLEATGTLYQKGQNCFDLLLIEPIVVEPFLEADGLEAGCEAGVAILTTTTPRLLWLDISPYRLALTMQGNGKFSYRHIWAQGVYGSSRYWLQADLSEPAGELCLQNFSRNLIVSGHPCPTFIQLDYELWAGQLQLGRYIFSLEIR